MARIRTIKPEFFTSEDIVALSPHARLLYIALWCEADKEGRMTWKPNTFKLRYLPGDAVDIQVLATELVQSGLVVLYGDGYAVIPKFRLHQHINPRESVSTIPAPPGDVPEMPSRVSRDVSELVYERDGNACVRCGSTNDLTLDHILPQSIGGPHIAENLRVMCRACNSARPVAGAALAEDLKSDGYTVADLRVRFGIDASGRVTTRANQELHAQGGREGKGKEGDIGHLAPDGADADDPPAPTIVGGAPPTKPKPSPLPKCPVDQVIAVYHEALPNLPRIKLMDDRRQKEIDRFWRWVLTSKKTDGTPRATTADEAVDWTRAYFGRAAENDFLMGRGQRAAGHENWRCDLEFLLSDKGRRHVIEKTGGQA